MEKLFAWLQMPGTHSSAENTTKENLSDAYHNISNCRFSRHTSPLNSTCICVHNYHFAYTKTLIQCATKHQMVLHLSSVRGCAVHILIVESLSVMPIND